MGIEILNDGYVIRMTGADAIKHAEITQKRDKATGKLIYAYQMEFVNDKSTDYQPVMTLTLVPQAQEKEELGQQKNKKNQA